MKQNAPGGSRAGAARAVWRDTCRHPFSIIQNLAGGLIALATPGEPGAGPGGWRYIENARGLGAAIPRWFGQDAITIGCHTFAVVALARDRVLYWHEYRHYRQSIAWGPAFIPAYLLVQAVRGYRCNPFEQDAARWAKARVEQLQAERRRPE